MRRIQTHTHKTRAGALMAVSVLVPSSVVFGVGTHTAAAVPATMPAPQLQSVRVEPPNAIVDFTDRSDNETGFFVFVRERNNPDRLLMQQEVRSVPGSGRKATQSVGEIPAGVPVCATVQAIRRDQGVLADVFGSPIEYVPWVEESPQSNTVCTDPATAPSELALQNIRGKAEQQWATVSGQAPAYLVGFGNTGADATGIVVDISTSGVATLGDQAAVQAGWAANGFACASRPPSGGETAALRCTGGSLKKGEQANPAMIVRFTGPGVGTIHASISGPDDTSTSNNGTAFNVTVV